MRTVKKDFLVLDESELKIIFSLTKGSREFIKLDQADQKITCWLLTNSPRKLRGWIRIFIPRLLKIKKKLDELKSTVNALAKEDLQKPVDQFLAEILLIKEQLDELSDLVNKPIKNDE